MQRLIATLVWIGIAVCAGFLASALAFPAWAQEVEAGQGLLCDTTDEVEKYLALAVATNSSETALQEVNGGTNACAIAKVAFMRGAEVKQVRTSHGTFAVVQITIVGADLGRGLLP